MTPTVQLLARVDPDAARRLKKALVDEGLTYRAWLEPRIREFLEDDR